MEEETDLSQNSALKVLYQKAQASLMFRLVTSLLRHYDRNLFQHNEEIAQF